MGDRVSASRAQPFLRWAGSKRQLLPILERYWCDGYDRYLEPFAGSACLYFRLRPRKALLGDANAELIQTYRAIKKEAAVVAEHLLRLKKGREEYLRLRSLDPERLTPSERAARFIYLNRFCFNGLYRTNAAGQFNVPYGGDKAGNLPSPGTLSECSRLLRTARLVQGDFEGVLKLAEPGDFVYMDPPFSVANRRVFAEYNPTVFGPSDLARLRFWMESLAERNIAFLVSYADCAEAEALRKDFEAEKVTVKRNIAGFAARRGESGEVLIYNTTPGARRLQSHVV